MKIAVTGALGHIGSQLIRDLPASFPGAEIVMIDNMSCQRYCSLFNLPSGVKYRFIEEDVLESDLERLFEKTDVVVHLAAITDAANSFSIKDKIESNNFNSTRRVADACLKTGAKMIFPSSTSVYGTQSELVDENCTEDELKPQSPYAETKLKEERYLQSLDSLDFVIFRFGTICGVSPGMRFHTAVNKFCWQAVMGQPLTVWRTALNQKRPYLALQDAIGAIYYAIANDKFDKAIYNILTSNLTVDSIIKGIRKYIPEVKIDFVDSMIMNQLSYEVANSKFMNTGFGYKCSIEENIKETINLFLGIGK